MIAIPTNPEVAFLALRLDRIVVALQSALDRYYMTLTGLTEGEPEAAWLAVDALEAEYQTVHARLVALAEAADPKPDLTVLRPEFGSRAAEEIPVIVFDRTPEED